MTHALAHIEALVVHWVVLAVAGAALFAFLIVGVFNMVRDRGVDAYKGGKRLVDEVNEPPTPVTLNTSLMGPPG